MSQMTKIEIAIVFKDLMKKTPLNKIKVTDIVRECNINRQTFYYHFSDKYALLKWIYRNEALANISDCKTYDTWQEAFLKIFLYVNANYNFCMNTYQSLAREHFDNFLYELTFKYIYDIVKDIAKDTNVRENELKFIANFYSFAFIGILTNWMVEGMKENPKKIINNLNNLIEGNFYRAMH